MGIKLKHGIYRLLETLYYLVVLAITFTIFGLLYLARIEILLYFGYTFILHYILLGVFLVGLIFTSKIVYSIHKKVKPKLFASINRFKAPSYIELYGLDYPELKLSDFNLTKSRFQELLKNDPNNSDVIAYKKSLDIFHHIRQEKFLK